MRHLLSLELSTNKFFDNQLLWMKNEKSDKKIINLIN